MTRRFLQRLALASLLAVGAGLLCVGWRNLAGAAPPAPTPANSVAAAAPSPTPLAMSGPSMAYVGGEWAWAGTCRSSPYGQGAYVDPGRVQHVPEYRLRVDDVLELLFRRTHEQISDYRLNIGDRIRVELPPPMGAEAISREVVVQPDGNITLPILGPVPAARLRMDELTSSLAEKYRAIYKPHMAEKVTVTPLLMDAKLADLINTVDSRYGAGGQARVARVTPDGSIALPVVGSVPVIGLTLDELKGELSHRYQAADMRGLEVQPVLQTRAPRHVFVLGEVRTPGRYPLDGPTTAIQAITLAGGVTAASTANLRQVVIFRRTQDWQMIATMIDLYEPIINGTAPCAPVADLWVADADIVIVPKTKILVFDEWVNVVLTRGIYGVIPMQGITIGFAKTSSL